MGRGGPGPSNILLRGPFINRAPIRDPTSKGSGGIRKGKEKENKRRDGVLAPPIFVTDRRPSSFLYRSVSDTDLDSLAVVLHVDLAVAGDLARFDHRLEVCQVIHVTTHVRCQHLHHPADTVDRSAGLYEGTRTQQNINGITSNEAIEYVSRTTILNNMLDFRRIMSLTSCCIVWPPYV